MQALIKAIREAAQRTQTGSVVAVVEANWGFVVSISLEASEVESLTEDALREAVGAEVDEMVGMTGNTGDALDLLRLIEARDGETDKDIPDAVTCSPGDGVNSAILEIQMQDLVGDYDVPEDVPEWAWIEQNASFSHKENGSSGVWEFMINLGKTLPDIPPRLAAVVERARQAKAAYLLFHQGT